VRFTKRRRVHFRLRGAQRPLLRRSETLEEGGLLFGVGVIASDGRRLLWERGCPAVVWSPVVYSCVRLAGTACSVG
jgi:hypothetical protein